MDNIECEHCGGTDFYKEAGFFFCKGCQVQSQEVQEYVFDEFTAETKTKTRKVQSEKSEKVDNKITSWECYNHILLGLTEELINLGAHRKFKSVVRILWLRYLEKMKVFTLGQNQLPKLQAVSNAIDAEIVYGKLAKRKRKRRQSSSSEVDLTTLDSSSLKQERIRRKRALIKAQYEDLSQKSQGTPSLHNETLASLQSSEKSSKSKPLAYNIYASRELKRIQRTRYHWRKHIVDFERNLKCHRVSYRRISHRYRQSPYILSLNKLYSILYLALLIVKDKIQLGDLLRFIKEGKLSFNCYSHFFPENFADKRLNFRNFKKNSVFANTPFRVITSEMSVFLDVDYYVVCPDLVELSERYCKELNLPREICTCVKNLLTRADVRMSFRKRVNKVPNYEGRVLSIILFVVKLLFGLDDVTEIHLGTYADILNRSDLIKPRMFNVVEWLKHIEYRDWVMTEEHFPTNFNKSCEPKINLALGVLGKKEYPAEVKINANKDNYKQLLSKLKSELDEPDTLELPVTFTPFFDFVKLLPKSKYMDILSKDFSGDSLDHILKPSRFLEILNDQLVVVHGGANDDWVFEKLVCNDQKRRHELKEKRRLVTVKLSFDCRSERENHQLEENNDCEHYKDNFYAANEASFLRNMHVLSKNNPKYRPDLDFDAIRNSLDASREEYPNHYNPYERFWMRTKLRLELQSQQECKKFLETFPYNFRVVFKECQRIAQQNEQELLVEYQMTELHLVHLANYGKKTHKQTVIKDKLISNYLQNCTHLW
ncbi:hypothetical protein Zmor_026189 [Zophobas morio]|uniref:Rrn7/TAF1B C-terminal cyclin domain-containing protein n=1 Tax=Zophobas morio TaxID=2755281 RepID=A0AA38HT27_9CUCU|nr:hypothetical protein Zmor_026189 [Zophobas morio]